MVARQRLEDLVICECGEKTIAEAIEIFQNTSLPYKRAKQLVTGCNKSCCRKPLMKLFDMVLFGKIDVPEVARLINLESDFVASMIENLKPEGGV